MNVRIARMLRAMFYRTDRAYSNGGALNAAVLLMLLFCANYLLSRSGTCTSLNQTLSAIIWPAPVLGIALLLGCERRLTWWLGVMLLFVTQVFAGSLDWVPWPVDVLFAAINVIEAVIGAWFVRRYISFKVCVDTLRGFATFLLLLPVATASIHATLAAAILSVWLDGRVFIDEWSRAYVANVLALLTVLPTLLMWKWQALRVSWSKPQNWLPSLAMVGVLCVAELWSDQGEIARVMLALSLCWAALEGGLALVTKLNACAVIGLITMTIRGRGPYVSHYDGHGVWALQVDLIGVVILSMCIAIATGERRRLARQIDRSRRFESLGFFAGGIVHDFNNVLTTIACYAEYASEQLVAADRVSESIGEINQAIERGRDLTKQILLAARRGEPVLARVRLAEVIAEAVGAAKVAAKRDVEIIVCGDDERLIVVADRSQIERAILNLVDNAVRAARTTVVVSVGDSGAPAADAFDVVIGEQIISEGVWIEVSDNGGGIDVEPLDRIFEPFFSSRSEVAGTGLGLAIVAGAAIAHRGQIAVETGRGRGSRFRLMLPAARKTSASSETERDAQGAVPEIG
ncbi:histidine kinase [Burkholderia cepacia]|uniref:histidine kinase n=1 Tax=Burkholderia cepacia TaxID=292 RepID=A0A0J5WRV7_BURCE|nr:histidine kinase [Burkholderia cepacia]